MFPKNLFGGCIYFISRVVVVMEMEDEFQYFENTKIII